MERDKMITFGEIMLKLSPLGFFRFTQANSFQVEYAGAEANVAVSLANFGLNTSFITKVPNNEIGISSVRELRKNGINVDSVVFGGERMGIYFVEKGASQRSSKVVYDRKYSSISQANEGDFDWDTIFEDAQWFHFTGITPALSDKLAEITLQACIVAKRKGIKVSCDLNYRNKLWTKDRANEVMSRICQYVDICIANEEDAFDVFGISANNIDTGKGELSQKSYFDVAKSLKNKFEFELVAITLRESISASENNWSAILFDGDTHYTSRKYSIHIVDRIGGGDSFGAGLIYGYLQNLGKQEMLDFAVAASCLKHSIEGDSNLVSVAEVQHLLNTGGGGRIQR